MSILVRRLINEILTLEKDEERIKQKISSRTSDEVYDDQGQEDWGDYSRRDANRQRVHDERELKRIWAEEVKEEGTRDFFDKELVKIHWIGAYSDDERDPVRGIADYIRKYGTKKSQDEVSCFAYERWDGAAWDDSIPEASSFGVIVKGYTTYASTIDAKTHMPSKADDEAKKKHKSSGLHKRPTKFKGNEEKDSTSLNAGYMIVDKESFRKRRRDFHEVLVDNWSPSEAFVIKNLRYFELEEKQWRQKAEFTPVEEYKEETLRLKKQREEDLAFIAKSGFKIYDRRFREQAIPNPFKFDDKEFFENTWQRLASDDENDQIFSTVVLKDSPPEESFAVTKKAMNLRTINLEGKLAFNQCRFGNPNKGGIECSPSGASITFNRCSGRLGKIISGAINLYFISTDFGGEGYDSLDIQSIQDEVSIPNAKFKDCNFGDGKVLAPFLKRFLNQDTKISMDNCKLDESSSKRIRDMIGARNVEEFFKILEKPLVYKWPSGLTPPPGIFLAPPPPTMTGSQNGNLPPLPPLPNLPPLPPLPPLPGAMAEARLLRMFIREELQELFAEAKNNSHPSAYKAPRGSKRDKQLDKTQVDLKSGDPERIQRAYRRRERMEKQARSQPDWENKPRQDTQSESQEASLQETIQTIDEALSKKLKATLRKKALKRGLTPGSVESEYKKGLAAYASSGSRPGMTAHQWAMARVNAATPSKKWATVKKSKKKK